MPLPESYRPTIDPNALDRELIDQPGMYFDAAMAKVEADAEVARARVNVDIVRAEKAAEIRCAPEDYDITKVTEAAIAEAVAAQPEVRGAQDRLIRATRESDICRAAVTALDHKKSALGKLTDLHLANYFSDPRPSAQATAMAQEIGKRAARGPGVRQPEPEEDDGFQ